MPETIWGDSGVSEVIGAVLLVALVVIGGAVVATFVFSGPTPKEVPHLTFAAVKNDTQDTYLTLHHTGGDTLLWGDYRVIVDGVDKTNDITPQVPWSLDGDLKIENVASDPQSVVLTFDDGSGGETVLRKVIIGERSPVTAATTPIPWSISGQKRNVTGAYTGPEVTITLYRKLPGNDNWEVVTSTMTSGSDHTYSFVVPAKTETYRIEETVPAEWRAVNPQNGRREVLLNPGGNNYWDGQDFVNEYIPVTTTTTTTTTTPPTTIPTPTPAFTTISGHKWRVNETNVLSGIPAVPGIEITLELVSGTVPDFPKHGMMTTTLADGSYSFTVPNVPEARFRLTEQVDKKDWQFTIPANGVIDGVVAGGSGYDFRNCPTPVEGGVVMYLNKTSEGCGGYVVDGTTLLGEANQGDTVEIGDVDYTFGKDDKLFRFTIIGNQSSGELKIEAHDLTKLTFNVRFEVSKNGNQWTEIGTGVPSAVTIHSINKNAANEKSTLTYVNGCTIPSDTLLRLNGEVAIDSPADNTYLEFSLLHIVHDNRYGEGLNTMWLNLQPGYNLLLVQGKCDAPVY